MLFLSNFADSGAESAYFRYADFSGVEVNGRRAFPILHNRFFHRLGVPTAITRLER